MRDGDTRNIRGRQKRRQSIFRAFDADFHNGALAMVAKGSAPLSHPRSEPTLRSSPVTRKVRAPHVSGRTSTVPSYLWNEADYIRMFGY
jgi:hypothetical protein